MMVKNKFLIALIVMVSICCQCVAADVVDLFVKAPRSVLPLLDPSTRMDMVDYYRSGMSTASSNIMDGRSRVTQLSDSSLTISISDASTLQMVLLPVDKKNEVLCCIFTLKTPQPDSWMEFYSTDWKKLDADRYFTEPTVTDWLTKEGRKDEVGALEKIPFMLASYTCVGQDGKYVLTMKNEMPGYFGRDEYDGLKSLLRPELKYVWSGKAFKRQ